MRKITIIYTFLIGYCLLSEHAFGQSIENEPVGNFYDIYGTHIDGFLDIGYEPETAITKFKDSNEGIAYYYKPDGDKVYGEIKFLERTDQFKFKAEGDDKFRMVKQGMFTDFVVHTDSFTVLKEFSLNTNTYNNRYVKIFKQTKHRTFYIYDNGFTNYLVKENNSDLVTYIPYRGVEFRKACLKVFAEVPQVIRNIEAKKYKGKEDLPEMIRMLDYKNKFDNQSKIYFASGWKEVKEGEPYCYYGKVTSFTNGTYSISYYDKMNRKIYDGTYSSSDKMKKNGEFTWYHSNGNPRKTVSYENDEPQGKYKTYYENGNPHYIHSNLDGETYYHAVYNKEAVNLLDQNGNGEEILEDEKMKRKIVRKYEGHKLKSAYYQIGNENKIYQKSDIPAKLKKIKWLEYDVQNERQYPQEAFDNDVQGQVLIRLVIDSQGNTYNYKVINGVDPKIDKLALKAIQEHSNTNKWKPAIVNKKKVQSEVVIPVRFTIGKPSSSGYNYYDHYWIHQHHQFHTPITPPPGIR